MERRGGAGRPKIPIEEIENESNLQVTFSKWRSGVFNKANEISTLTGSQTVVIIFSPAGKPCSYGNPNVDSILDRFMNDNPPPSTVEDDRTQQIIRTHQRDKQYCLNAQLDQLMTLVEYEKKHGQALHEVTKASEGQNLNWWERPMDELDLHQLEQLKVSLEQVKSSVKDNAGAMQTNWPALLPLNALDNPSSLLIIRLDDAGELENSGVGQSQTSNTRLPDDLP